MQNSMDCIVHGVAESDLTEQLSLSLSGITMGGVWGNSEPSAEVPTE